MQVMKEFEKTHSFEAVYKLQTQEKPNPSSFKLFSRNRKEQEIER